MSVIKPLVKKPFTYNGKEYKINDVWEPIGSKNDKLIVAQKRVVYETVEEPQKEVKRGSKKSR